MNGSQRASLERTLVAAGLKQPSTVRHGAGGERELRRKHEAAVRRHEADLARAEEGFARQLADPAYATALGLPAELPDFTIGVLRRTMALDVIGLRRPTLAATIDKFGPTAPRRRDG